MTKIDLMAAIKSGMNNIQPDKNGDVVINFEEFKALITNCNNELKAQDDKIKSLEGKLEKVLDNEDKFYQLMLAEAKAKASYKKEVERLEVNAKSYISLRRKYEDALYKLEQCNNYNSSLQARVFLKENETPRVSLGDIMYNTYGVSRFNR